MLSCEGMKRGEGTRALRLMNMTTAQTGRSRRVRQLQSRKDSNAADMRRFFWEKRKEGIVMHGNGGRSKLAGVARAKEPVLQCVLLSVWVL